MSLNKVTLIGKIVNDPYLQKMPHSGNKICILSIITRDSLVIDKKKIEKTNKHSVMVFNSAAEMCIDRVRKGNLIYLEGRIDQRDFTDKDGVDRKSYEIISTFIDFDVASVQNVRR